MRLGTLKSSDLIEKIGHEGTTMRVKYRADGKVFDYFKVPLSTFKAIVRSRNPGRDWLSLRDQYDFKQVKNAA